MFFIVGISSPTKVLGPGSTQVCPRCGNQGTFTRVRSSRQLTAFFVIPLWRWGRREYEQCGICSHAVAI